jgi:hypothetical protein
MPTCSWERGGEIMVCTLEDMQQVRGNTSRITFRYWNVSQDIID